ncbi:MAG: hypothetical protein ACTS22_06895 [Phycisphaerales bacterium]
MTHAAPTDNQSISSRLGPAMVGLREDLEVHRHVFRGEPSYVIRDPMTLAVHRVSAEDYQVVASMSRERSLAETFAGLVGRGVLGAEDEEGFYRFVLSLHSLGFLSLPVPDDKSLYERLQKKQRARRMAKVMGFLFLQVPLVNPDAFLGRTAPLVAWAFSRWAVMVWTVVVGAALVLLAQNRTEFFQPLGTIFTPERILGLWLTLVGMKVLHEFGHAYACKLRGGEVPEIGVYLIAGTPAAYVDATSSWGFTQKRDRLAVVLAGMYVELFIAALAVFVWATTSSVTVQIMAFDVVLVAGIATILANLNPLMRFDGYYILSDLLEIPNLRGTSQAYTLSLLKRITLGTPVLAVPYSRRMRAFFVLFGTAGAIYKVTIVMGIAALLATKALWLGITVAGAYALGEVFKTLRGIGRFLVHSEAAAERRLRASVLAMLVFAFVPAALLFVPVPRQLKASATVGREIETTQFVPLPGFVESVEVRAGSQVVPGELLAVVRNENIAGELTDAAAKLEEATIQAAAALGVDWHASRRHDTEAGATRERMARLHDQSEAMQVRSDEGGTVVEALSSADTGRFVTPTEPIARIVGGRWVVRALVRADVVALLEPTLGDPIRFRPLTDPGVTISGTIVRITPSGRRSIEQLALTGEGGGDIPISPVTGEANEPYFEIEATIEPDDALRYGVSGRVLLGSVAEPIAVSARRAALRLLQRLEHN